MNEIIKLIGTGVVGGVGGGFISAYLTHSYTRCRESSARKRNFVAFMRQFEAKVRDVGAPGLFGKLYANERPELVRQAALISGDFSGDDRKRFDDLIAHATGFTDPKVNTNETRESVLQDIAAIISLIQ